MKVLVAFILFLKRLLDLKNVDGYKWANMQESQLVSNATQLYLNKDHIFMGGNML